MASENTCTPAFQFQSITSRSPPYLTGPLVIALMTTPLLIGCQAFNPPLGVENKVDVSRYMGRWYEIARYPNSFEAGCVGVTADYELLDDGRVGVTNTCRQGSLNGKLDIIEGVARVTDERTNARLAVSFFWPFEGDYWILELGDEEDYGYAVVGEPSRKFLWILSRNPQMDEELYEDVLSRLRSKGYNRFLLERTRQRVEE